MTDATVPVAYSSRLQRYLDEEDNAMACSLAVNIAKDQAFYDEHIRHMVEQGLASKTLFRDARVRLGDYVLTFASHRVKGFRHDELLLFWMTHRIQEWAAERAIRPSNTALMRAARELAEHYYAMREAHVRTQPWANTRA